MSDAESQARRLRALVDSGLLFAGAVGDVDRVLDVVARQLAELVGDGCNIRLVEGDQLVSRATYHPDADGVRMLRATTLPVSIEKGPAGVVLATGEPFFKPDIAVAELAAAAGADSRGVVEKLQIAGTIVVRLRARGTNLGVIALFRTARDPYTADDLALVRDVADRAALAIDNSRMVESLERRVAERTAALEVANKQLEAFAHSVSHDLRSPLRAIDGFATTLETDHAQALDDEARRMLGVIRKNTLRMTQLVDELLRLSRVDRDGLGQICAIEVQAMVDAVIETARAARPGRSIEAQLGELPTAIANPELLRQVWTNLIDNAIKYSGKRDVVRIEIDGTIDETSVRYSITDHGAGFDPAQAGKLFGVFQRLHSDTEFEGTGVGLALVQRIVTRHGGTVMAEGRPGEGATFSFTLPSRGPVE